MLAFTYDMLPSRVVFGVGCLDKLPEEIERLGAHARWFCPRPSSANKASKWWIAWARGPSAFFDRAVMHVPIEIAEQARGASQGAGRGLLRRGGRRIDHRTGESHRAGVDTSDFVDPNHLRGLGDDAHLGHHRKWFEEDRPRSARASEDRAL